LSSYLETTNEGYALAKISVLKYVEYIKKFYKKDFISLMPTNLYGPNDNYILERAHVVPALIHKIYLATKNRDYKVEVWGDGSARRDFIFVSDVATGMLSAVNAKKTSVVNIATGRQSTIRDLVKKICLAFNYDKEVIWNLDKPTGANSREMDTEKIKNLIPNWKPISLQQGILDTVSWFSENYLSTDIRK
jgi:GDP-L-fucose synthase